MSYWNSTNHGVCAVCFHMCSCLQWRGDFHEWLILGVFMAVQCTEPLSSTSGKPFPTLFISILLQGSHCSEGCAVASQRVSKYPFNKGSWDINALFSTSSSKLNHTLQWDFNDLMKCMYHTSHIYIYMCVCIICIYIYAWQDTHTRLALQPFII